MAYFALLGLLTSLAFGLAKLELQRAHPPSWATKASNSFDGYVSIDRFSERAALMRDCLRGEEASGAELRDFLRDELHPTTLTVPALVAGVSLVTTSIPLAFALVSSLAGALLALVTGRLAQRLAPQNASLAGWTAAALLLFHGLTLRTTSQLILDGACAALIVASVLAALRWSRERRPGTAVALWLLLTLGLFTKVSVLPVLLAPALATWFDSNDARRGRLALVDVALFTIPPLALVLLYLGWLTGVSAGARDMQHLAATWSLSPGQLRHFGVEMALLFQALPLLAFVRRPALDRGAASTTAATLFVLLGATWLFGLPPIPRLYLPVLALGAALVGARLAGRADARPAWLLLISYALVNVAIAGYGLVRIAA